MSHRGIKVGKTGQTQFIRDVPFQGKFGKVKVVICPLCNEELFPMSSYYAHAHARRHVKQKDIPESEKVPLIRKLLGLKEK